MLSDEKILELAIKHFGGLSPEITLTGNSQRFARAIEAAVLAEQKAAIPQTMIERMKSAVEGECDGLAITDAIAAADKRIAELTELAEKMSIAAMEERHRRIEVYGDLKVAREAMSKAASLECNGVIRVALAQIGGDDVPR